MKFICALLTGLAAATAAYGHPETPAAASGGSCIMCHTSASPTKERPSLRQCPRAESKGEYSTEQAPKTIVLGEAKEQYGPVKFSHKAHAEMSEMGGGCYQCHHYDRGGRIQRCRSCHSAVRARTDVGTPDLKGALHQLCLQCHREWGHSTDCAVCHGSKALPKPEIPGQLTYKTGFAGGKIATFPHSDHGARFGLKCADCHKGETCSACHDLEREGVSPRASAAGAGMEAAHRNCSRCHAADNCAKCHSAKPAGAFDHGRSAGWSLNRFHKVLACRQCHTDGKFAKRDTGCDSCHKDWQKNFEHKKTGLTLDGTHSGLSCDSCHGDKEFSAPPVCSACHDKTYPKDKPGKLAPK